jgi:hypothetical protein
MCKCNHCDVELTQDNWRYMGRKRPAYTCTVCDRVHANIRKQAAREFVAKYKIEKGCEYCGYNKTHYALDLAHIDREDKSHQCKNNKSAYNQNWSINRIKIELEKCRILCANCHREDTAKENGWRSYDQ